MAVFPAIPLSTTMTLSETSQAWNGFASLFFQASHSFVSEAESFLSICALVIAGFGFGDGDACGSGCAKQKEADRKSTRLNSSHVRISYAVFCLKKKYHT